MTLKLKNQKAVNKYLAQTVKRLEAALIYQLEYLVALLENHAKQSAEYEDDTSNLKGSIGGVVLKDGRPITYRGFEGTSEGTLTGLEYINSLISDFGKGYTILMVAGMEYATYVENYNNLNVLKKSELRMKPELAKIFEKLKLKFK